MGCYNSELEMFSKCIADECNKHLERKGYQAMVFTGSLGHSAVQSSFFKCFVFMCSVWHWWFSVMQKLNWFNCPPGTSLLYFQEHVRLKWGKFAVKVFRLAGQIPITLIGDPLWDVVISDSPPESVQRAARKMVRLTTYEPNDLMMTFQI